MTTPDATATQAFWNRVAHDWDRQVGDSGDKNRRLNSDPVLWSFMGDVRGRSVLDAGCGTGYLSRQLHERGADYRCPEEEQPLDVTSLGGHAAGSNVKKRSAQQWVELRSAH